MIWLPLTLNVLFPIPAMIRFMRLLLGEKFPTRKKFRTPLTALDKMIYLNGRDYMPVYWNRCLIDVPVYHGGNLAMHRMVFDSEQFLN